MDKLVPDPVATHGPLVFTAFLEHYVDSITAAVQASAFRPKYKSGPSSCGIYAAVIDRAEAVGSIEEFERKNSLSFVLVGNE